MDIGSIHNKKRHNACIYEFIVYFWHAVHFKKLRATGLKAAHGTKLSVSDWQVLQIIKLAKHPASVIQLSLFWFLSLKSWP